eukprot:Gb_22075 [translate_table: standard]
MLRGTQPRRSGSEAWKLIVKNWEEVAGRTFLSPGHEDDNGFVDYHLLKVADKLNEELFKVELKLGNTTLARTEGLRSWEGSYQWFPDEPPTQTIWRIVFKTTLYIIWTMQMQAFFNNQKFSTDQTLGKIIS